MSLGQRYSVMVRLDQPAGNYFLRFATYPTGDMQQVLEGQAIVSYDVSSLVKSSLTSSSQVPSRRVVQGTTLRR